jgi:hypothetical protein
VCKTLVVAQIVDGDDFDVSALRQSGAEVVAANAAKAVDANLYGHSCSPDVECDLQMGIT